MTAASACASKTVFTPRCQPTCPVLQAHMKEGSEHVTSRMVVQLKVQKRFPGERERSFLIAWKILVMTSNWVQTWSV